MLRIALKRIYEPASEEDGQRILVDRLWPRGVAKAKANLAGWLKDVAPSPELRRWYDHEPERWAEFRHGYFAELEHKQSIVQFIREAAMRGPVTLVFAARTLEYSHARALKEFLEKDA